MRNSFVARKAMTDFSTLKCIFVKGRNSASVEEPRQNSPETEEGTMQKPSLLAPAVRKLEPELELGSSQSEF